MLNLFGIKYLFDSTSFDARPLVLLLLGTVVGANAQDKLVDDVRSGDSRNNLIENRNKVRRNVRIKNLKQI